MNYSEVKIKTTEGGLEILTGLLLNVGITDTIVNSHSTAFEILDEKEAYQWDYVNPEVFSSEEPTLHSEAELVFYLECTEEGDGIFNEVKTQLNEMQAIYPEIFKNTFIEKIEVEDTNWIEKYKNSLKPVKIGENILIRPTWCESESLDLKDIEIVMDPGMAFGTGDHPTTFMCAEFLIEEGCENKVVLDVGTGSGILAILAEKLGSTNVLGVDIDPIAVEVAKENGVLNNCKCCEFFEGDLTKGLNIEADIVVGNLMAEIVCLLAKSVMKHMKPDASFISSGILLEKKEMVSNTLIEEGFYIEEIKKDGEWCAIKAGKA